ncbi:Vps62-like protein [Phanerochaete sordida]|uniref:Vps62-like protein n=1 Tax=Phanerochaete sordida TaxID=48140 RepID=A0A9P3FXV2_9APHY|nr:Vps62-like protein [Phanerochaete sordida]
MSWSTLRLACLLGVVPSLVYAAPAVTPLPSYVTQFAPLSHLDSTEVYFPADVANHLTHVQPEEDMSAIASSVTFSTIGSLSSDVFLTSKDTVEDIQNVASWLNGVKPESTGLTSAPATIVAVQKAGGIVDAFYFYFYSYDHATYLGLQFGDHVGDWEHSMVRFVNGVPQDIYLSAHDGGSAYTYSALPSQNGRAITYIANGTHANYASPGSHQHDLPGLDDQTDAGSIWDVTLNFRGYWFDNSTQTFTVASGAGTGGSVEAGEGVGWLNFAGRWGDEQYDLFHEGQYCVTSDECKYVSGPTGPIAKNLGRTAVCQDESSCTIQTSV